MVPTVITALITPFDDLGHIHKEDFQHCLLRQNNAGNAVVLFGSTGEGFCLTLEEKKHLLDIALAMNLDVPLFVAISSPFLHECLDFINYCQKKNIFGFLLTTPPYSKPGSEGQEHWFRSLMDVANKPCLLYNIPGRSVVSLCPTVVKNLAHHQCFYGLKDSGSSLEQFLTYKSAIPQECFGKIQLYCGNDYFMPFIESLGARGLVSAMANVWPEATKHYVHQCLNGHVRDLDLWFKASQDICYRNPISIKNLLEKKKIIHFSFVRPPLNNNDSKNLENLLFYDQCIDYWMRCEG